MTHNALYILTQFIEAVRLDVTVTVSLSFDPPVALSDPALDTYRTAVMNANQGMLHLRAIPARKRGAA